MARLISTLGVGAATLTLASILVACQEDAKPAGADALAEATSQSGSPRTGPAPAGEWISHLSRARVARQLKAAGLGKWTERFFKAEQWPKQQGWDGPTAVYTFTPRKVEDADTWRGTFQVAYFEAADYWHVGWKGLMRVDGDRMSWGDDYSNASDRFRWRDTGDNLAVTWKGSDLKAYKGIPSPVYMVAYFTDPLKPSDCPMDPETNC
jgi:hypothetical protein